MVEVIRPYAVEVCPICGKAEELNKCVIGVKDVHY